MSIPYTHTEEVDTPTRCALSTCRKVLPVGSHALVDDYFEDEAPHYCGASCLEKCLDERDPLNECFGGES